MATKEYEAYEEMKAQVLTAVALAVTENEIRALHDPMLLSNRGLMGEDALISVDSTCTEGWFAATSLSESHLLNYSFSFAALEKERERLLNKPEWPEDKQWQARAVESNGWWYFYEEEPTPDESRWLGNDNRVDFSIGGKAHGFPAGYDWKESLEFRPE